MRIRTVLFLITILTNSYGHVPLGSWIVKIQFDDKTVLNFYKNPTDESYTKRIEFFDDNTINSWNIKNLEKEKDWLNPEVLWLGYSQFHFRCVSADGAWLEVVVNNENGQTYWIRRSEKTEVLTWESYLKGMFGVSRRKHENLKIRQLPADSARDIEYDGPDCFQVKSLKDEWIEIFTRDNCDELGTKTEIKSGWIKWRSGDKLLIDYYTTS